MRLICSPILSEGDHEALREGYSERAEIEAGHAIAESFRQIMETEQLVKPAIVLASLVASGVIDCKIAWVGEEAGGRPKRLFHDKVGILADRFGDCVAFKGSMNETWPGLARDGNLESVDVFLSWRDDGERVRVADEMEYFDRVWEDDWPGITVRSLPDTARSAIVSAADAGRWPEFVDEICLELDQAARWSAEAGKARVGGFPTRTRCLRWKLGRRTERRGIFKHATGSGKTYTALCAIGDGLGRGEIPLVLVPSELLLKQWEGELRGTFNDAGLQLMICGGGHSRWRDGGRLRTWTRPGDGAPRAVLATVQTASTEEFRGLCVGGGHLFMVADEVHRLGADGARRLLTLDTGARLGLSATPERAGDPDGTAALMEYFGGIVPPPFGLEDAIKAHALTPYAYNVHTVRLEDDERTAWVEATDEFRRLYARSMAGSGDVSESLSARLKLLLIRRARIVKSARAKIALAGGSALRGVPARATLDSLLRRSVPARRGQAVDIFGRHCGRVRVSQRHAGRSTPHPAGVRRARGSRRVDPLPGRGRGYPECFTRLDSRLIEESTRISSSDEVRVLRRSPGKSLAHLHDVVVAPEVDDEDAMGGSILKG